MSDIAIVPNTEPRTLQPGSQTGAGAAPPAFRGDIAIYRMVVIFLGLVMMASTAGALFCEMSAGREIPQFLIAMGSGALGALGGLLAPSPVAGGR